MGGILAYTLDKAIGSDVNGIRPVINLKADVQFTGNGTIDSPYEIVMN